MNVELDSQNTVLKKVSKQNAFAAALGVAFWCMPILVLWAFIYELKPAAATVMLAASGVLVGVAVRGHGRGYEPVFSLIGVLAHIGIVFSAWQLEILLGGQVLAVILVGVYIAGAWSAAYISRINVPFQEHKAFDQVFESSEYQQQTKLKNRWFIVLPLVSVLTFMLGMLTAICISFFQHQQFIDNQVKQQAQWQEKQEAAFRDKHINTSDESLAKMSIKKALTYAYAYESGRQFDEQGGYRGSYPQDSFQAKVILRFLAKKKQDPRAQFILGKILNNERGHTLIAQAEKAGDGFARLYSIYEFGCRINAKQGHQLLESFAKNVTEQTIITDIQGMRSDNFKAYCDVLANTKFDYRYIRNYKPRLY
jgi:multidrug efflux pump subunit AcrB